MGLHTSLCKKCDSELDWFLRVKKGIKCYKCGIVNTQEDLHNNYCDLEYYNNKELFIKKRRLLENRKQKILKLKKSI